MGFQTTVVFNNDFIHEMEKNPNFGKELYHSILSVNGRGESVELPGCMGRVIESHHADFYTVLALGNLNAVYLGGVSVNRDRKPIDILKELANWQGYNLIKKPKRKK